MFNFRDSIKNGMATANLVKKNKDEINELFKSLNEQISEMTDEKIILVRKQYSLSNLLMALVNDSKNDGTPILSKGILEICGKNEKGQANDNGNSIAKWEQHPDGYPFTIVFLDKRMDSWDLESLAQALSTVVASGQFWLQADSIIKKMVKEDPDNRSKLS